MAEETKEPKKKKATGAKIPAEDKDLIGVEVASQDSLIYKSYSFIDYNPDELAKKKGGLKIYRQMKTDEQIKACLMVKKYGRLSTKWEVQPGNQENAKAKEIADFCTYVLRNMRTSLGPEIKKEGLEGETDGTQAQTFKAGSFEDILYNIMSGLDYGFSISEKIWGYYEDGPYAGKLGMVGCKTKEPFGYDFKTDRFGNLLSLVPPATGRVKSAKDNQELPPSKFVIYSYNAEFNNWYGQSDLRPAYRGWWSKDMTIKWMNIYLERYGMPTTVFKYPTKGRVKPADLNAIDDILLNLQAKAGFRIPDNFTAELLEAKRTGEAGYLKAIEHHDKCISRAILIPNKLGFGDDEQGSYALGKKHFDLFLIVLEKLGKDLEETVVNEQILRPLVQYNFGQVDEELMPKFRFESLLTDDPKPKAEVLDLCVKNGLVDSREEWVREYLSLPKRDLLKYPHETPLGQPEPSVVPAFGDPNDPNAGRQPGKKAPGEPVQEPDDDEEELKKGKGKAAMQARKATMALSRKPGAYERKVNFERLQGNFDAMSEGLMDALREAMRGVKKDFEKQVGKAFDNGSPRDAVQNLKIRGMAEFKNTLRDYLVKAHLDTKLGALEELGKTGDFEVEIKRRFSAMFATQDIPFEPWDPLPPVEAIDFFNRKVLARLSVKGGKEITKTLIPLGIGKEMKYYDDRAFYIAGVEEKYLLDGAKNILLTGLEKGWSKRDLMNELADLFDKHVAQGQVVDGAVRTAARLETIVRTNLTEAYNRGRTAMFNHPLVADRVPYVMWSAIIDERTTDYCSNMDGKMFRREDIEPPPAHFNCRSVLVPITQSEVDEDPEAIEVTSQLTEESKTPRASGFKSAEFAINTAYRTKPEYWMKDPERCLYTTCRAASPKLKKQTGTVKVFHCGECDLDFKVSRSGDIYLWDVGEERYVRVTQGEWPQYFSRTTAATPKPELWDVGPGKCAYTTCQGKHPKLVKQEPTVKTYECPECQLPFRITRMGDLYLWDVGEEKFVRVTQGEWSRNFAERSE